MLSRPTSIYMATCPFDHMVSMPTASTKGLSGLDACNAMCDASAECMRMHVAACVSCLVLVLAHAITLVHHCTRGPVIRVCLMWTQYQEIAQKKFFRGRGGGSSPGVFEGVWGASAQNIFGT